MSLTNLARLGVCAVLFLFFWLAPRFSHAELILAPRYEYIGGKYELANRLQLKSKLSWSYKDFSFYAEAFGETDGAASARKYGRTTNRGYLQEVFLEYKWKSFYVRVGKQAMRWSESWSLPSLDLWTGRKFNRLFFDDFPNQLNHSSGILTSYASKNFSVDLVGVTDVAENEFPSAYPYTPPPKKNSWGGRAKWNLKGFGLTALAARINEKNSVGGGLNYAFESFVPKVEYGTLQERSVFSTLGCDFFLGNWILLPQVTFADGSSTYYTSLQWNPNKHDLQAQVFVNPQTKDSFASLSYAYNWTDHLSTAAFVQQYEGSQPGLYSIYKDIVGGTGLASGVRAELEF